MAVLLETNIGDIAIDLDLEGSPELCKNFLKLSKARYYTSSLIYNVQSNRFCQCGDPTGTGRGGACVYGVLEEQRDKGRGEQLRFLRSVGRCLTPDEKKEKGRVVATEMNGIPNTIGSQFLITVGEGDGNALDGYTSLGGGGGGDPAAAAAAAMSGTNQERALSLGQVTEDSEGVLDKIRAAYCDTEGRPYANIRILRALVLHDPFPDPDGMDQLLRARGVEMVGGRVTDSPDMAKPPEERVEVRIGADQIGEMEAEEETEEMIREREQKLARQQDQSRAVVLEMLGDLPSAEIRAPENVLFVCKLNPVTEDEDLELIFGRFDQNCKAEIIRDADTGNSLQYAFIEFSKKEQCVEAYFKMNNALIDDRRIKVDFSQSVAKIWNKYTQSYRGGKKQAMPKYDGNIAARKGYHQDRRREEGHRRGNHGASVDDHRAEESFQRKRFRGDDHGRDSPFPHGNAPYDRDLHGSRGQSGRDEFGRQRPPAARGDGRDCSYDPRSEVHPSYSHRHSDARSRSKASPEGERTRRYRRSLEEDSGGSDRRERRKHKKKDRDRKRRRYDSDEEDLGEGRRYNRDRASGREADVEDEHRHERRRKSRKHRDDDYGQRRRHDDRRNRDDDGHQREMDDGAYSRRSDEKSMSDEGRDKKRKDRYAEKAYRDESYRKRKKKHKKDRKRSRSR